MKGKWIFDLAAQIMKGGIRLSEGIGFVQARLAAKPTEFSLQGLHFENVDHILWSIVAEIFISREYSPSGFEINPQDIVVDIGAHKGAFTAYAASRTQNSILAFEPDPTNFAALQNLVERHGWDHVTARNFAISGKSGPVDLYLADSSSRNTITGKDQLTQKMLVDSLSIPALSLSEALGDIPQIDLVKMDCEGAEFSILASADQATLNKINRLVLEYHAAENSELLQSLLKKLGEHFTQVTSKHRSRAKLGYIFACR